MARTQLPATRQPPDERDHEADEVHYLTRSQRIAIDTPEARDATEITFDPRIAFEVALDLEDIETIFEKHGFEFDAAAALCSNPHFARKVQLYRDEILEGGVSFRLKAKLQAEDLLATAYNMALDPNVPAAVRSDLIQWQARMADLEPAKKVIDGQRGGGGAPFQLNISYYGGGTVQLSTDAGGEATPLLAINDGSTERNDDGNRSADKE